MNKVSFHGKAKVVLSGREQHAFRSRDPDVLRGGLLHGQHRIELRSIPGLAEKGGSALLTALLSICACTPYVLMRIALCVGNQKG